MKRRGIVPILISISLFQACQKESTQNREPKNTSITELHFSAAEATEWSDLFHRSSGWFGGDGIFVIPLSGVDSAGAGENDQTLILFSDTLIGEIEDGQLNPDYIMINNSVAILDGNLPSETDLEFYWDENDQGQPKSIFIPKTPSTNPGDYYWLGDGFVNHEKNNDIYVFGYRITNTEAEVFAFKEVGNTLIVIPAGSKPPFENQRQLDTPFYFEGSPESTGSFGAGILVNTAKAGAPYPDGYVYVYGVKGINKEVLVARVLPGDIEEFDKWRFWDGNEWQADMAQAIGIADRASNEMSVTPLKDGRYVMVFQTDGIGTAVSARLALSPEGPYGPMIQLWDAVDDVNVGEQFISYNAKVHANLSRPGELLISYNINSFDFFNEILVHPNLYRPRFIRVKLQE